jgi:diadenosine tetraphosphate (Ap4A) HIT family hydrolase
VAFPEAVVSCYTCGKNALTDPPPRESIVRTKHWRVAHSFDTSLLGWLVLVSLRHVLSLDELTEEESAELGPLLRRLTKALRSVTGCEKTYVILFAEAEEFAHIHFHVVPRMASFSDDERGPNVFTFLRRPEPDWVPESDRDRLALAVRAELANT